MTSFPLSVLDPVGDEGGRRSSNKPASSHPETPPIVQVSMPVCVVCAFVYLCAKCARICMCMPCEKQNPEYPDFLWKRNRVPCMHPS